ncbi:MAG: MFS transporter [Planctomycetota bacterium]|nr:MFS transporter [Planctomycetota bacterium]
MVHAAPTQSRLRANVARIQALSFTWMFMLVMPVIVPYLGSHDLGMDRVFQLQAIFAITIVLLEVPSGYISDLLGRRRCLILAGILHGLAATTLYWASSFSGFVVFELLAAVGVCFYSGTDVALLYDSLEALGDGGGKRRLLGRRLMWMQSGETVAALLTAGLLGASLGNYALEQVVYLNAVVGWVPFLVTLTLVDVPRPTLDHRTHLHNARLIWNGVFRESMLLRLVMINLITYGVGTLIAVWAFQDYWRSLEVNLAHFGILWAGYNLTVAFVGRVAHRIEGRLGFKGVVACVGILPVLGFGGMAFCSHAFGSSGGASVWVVLGVSLGLLFQIGRGLTQVVIKDALNTRVPAEWRATANSISSLGVRLSFFVLGPMLGWLIEWYGYPTALGAYSGLFALLLLTFNRWLRRRVGRNWEGSEPAEGPSPIQT